LGNAVPSLLAEVIGREIRRQFFGEKLVKAQPKLLPPSRGAPPAAEPVAPVAKRFKRLVGEHPAHPGTGKGFRAKAGYQPAA